jgi:hypothetical protein
MRELGLDRLRDALRRQRRELEGRPRAVAREPLGDVQPMGEVRLEREARERLGEADCGAYDGTSRSLAGRCASSTLSQSMHVALRLPACATIRVRPPQTRQRPPSAPSRTCVAREGASASRIAKARVS